MNTWDGVQATQQIMGETEELLILAWDEEDERQRKLAEEIESLTGAVGGAAAAVIMAAMGKGWPKEPGAEKAEDPGPPVGDSRP